MNGLLAAAVFAFACVGFAPPDDRDAPEVDLTKLSLPELARRLDESHSLPYFSSRRLRTDHFEAILQQFIKRGGPEVEALLSERLQQRPTLLKRAEAALERIDHDRQLDAWVWQNRIVRHHQQNLELVTALRRVQNKPDPLQIEVLWALDMEELPPLFFPTSETFEAVKNGSAKSSKQLEAEFQLSSNCVAFATDRLKKIDAQSSPTAWTEQKSVVERLQKHVASLRWRVKKARDAETLAPFATRVNLRDAVTAQAGKLPIFVVARRSADVDRVPLRMRSCGGDRSGRESHWRLEVKDSVGNIVSARQWHSFVGGGIYTERFNEHGERSENAIPMSSFVEITTPGEYSVTLLYHNEFSIADFADPTDLDNLIVSRSKPVRLIVEKPKGD